MAIALCGPPPGDVITVLVDCDTFTFFIALLYVHIIIHMVTHTKNILTTTIVYQPIDQSINQSVKQTNIHSFIHIRLLSVDKTQTNMN